MKYLFPLLFLVSSCGSPSGSTSPPLQGKVVSSLYENDDNNCGAEGYVCVGGRTCSDSRCTPAWIEIESDGAPTSRGKAAAGFLDGKYVVLGGCTSTGSVTASSDGGSYDPSNDTWSSAPSFDVGRAQHSMVTTDDGIFSVGGITECWNGTAQGPGLEVLTDLDGSWFPVNPSGLEARYNAGFTWTGKSLFAYGGGNATYSAMASGGELFVGSNWMDSSCDISGCERNGVFSLFHDDGVIHLWGGYGVDPSAGLLYDLQNQKWYEWIVPSGTPDFSTVAVDGDPPRFADDGRRLFYPAANGDVLIFDRKTQSWSDDSSSPPSGFCPEGATAWTGSELISWSGICGGVVSDVGARYQPPAP